MAVRVRMFAALRDAAGTGDAEVPPGTLPALLALLRERYGQGFADVLARCSVLLDGRVVTPDASIEVVDGAELALLPPVSGGARRGGDRRRRGAGRSRLRQGLADRGGAWGAAATAASATTGLVGIVAYVAGAIALLAGREAFAAVVVGIAVVALLDLASLLGRSAPRPVLPMALLPSVILPIVLARDPRAGWEELAGWYAVALLVGFLLVLVTRRRSGLVDGLGATCLLTLVIGLGAAGLILSRAFPAVGFRLVAILGVLVAAADLAGPLARSAHAPTIVVALAPLAGAAVAAVGVGALGVDGLPPDVIALVAACAIAGVVLGDALTGSLQADAEGVAGPADPRRFGGGAMFAALDAVLIAAPAAYVAARATVG